jgi:hypothetical protein
MTIVEERPLRKEVEKTLHENRAALRVAERRARVRETQARSSRVAVERARKALRRAGLLK